MEEKFWIIYKKGWKNCVIFYPILQKRAFYSEKGRSQAIKSASGT